MDHIVDAVVQRDLQDTVEEDPIQKLEARVERFASSLASEYRPVGRPDLEPYRNRVLLPYEKASGQMLPIPPGAVRGVWKKPAVTGADVGKRMTVVGASTIMVDGDARSVGWSKDAPTGINDLVIMGVDGFNDEYPRVCFAEAPNIDIPYLAGAANEKTIDLAFALTEKREGGTISTRFFMPVRAENGDGLIETSLTDAREASVGGLQFHHFVGSVRT